MSRYGGTHNVPYTGQQDSNLGENPRYQGTGMQHPQQGTGQGGYGPPRRIGRYGSEPNAQAGYGGGQGYGSQTTGGLGANPNAQSGSGSRTRGTQTEYGGESTTGGYGIDLSAGMADPNTRPDQSGYRSQPTGGHGTHQQRESESANEQPGTGTGSDDTRTRIGGGVGVGFGTSFGYDAQGNLYQQEYKYLYNQP